MIDLEFVTFENNGKCYPDYSSAYFAGQRFGSKKVWYIFTPTWTKCRNVSELENCYRLYFNTRLGLDHYDIHNKVGSKQLSFMEN